MRQPTAPLVGDPPAPEAPAPAPLGLVEFIWRVFALSTVGPLRLAHSIQHEVPFPGPGVQPAHLNTSGKPMFVEIRLINGAAAFVAVVSSQESANAQQGQSVDLATGVFRAITYPSDRLFMRKDAIGASRVLVSEVTL